MKITVSSQGEKQLRKLPKFDQIAVGQKIRSLAGASVGEEKLSGFDSTYRVRVGNYRIVYKKLKESIFIFLIGHRKDIYKRLEQMFS
jgi:mRNA interferase RelE/StbE